VTSGVDIDVSYVGAYGQGFYTASEPDLFFGPEVVVVAVRLEQPFVGSMHEIESVVDAIARRTRPRDRGLTSQGSQAVRQELMSLGYDGIVVWDGGGDGVDYVIALDERTVKIVVVP
jgi:hypothetical protein